MKQAQVRVVLFSSLARPASAPPFGGFADNYGNPGWQQCNDNVYFEHTSPGNILYVCRVSHPYFDTAQFFTQFRPGRFAIDFSSVRASLSTGEHWQSLFSNRGNSCGLMATSVAFNMGGRGSQSSANDLYADIWPSGLPSPYKPDGMPKLPLWYVQ